MNHPHLLPSVPLLRVVVAFMAGIMTGDACADAVSPWVLVGVSAAVLLVAVALRVRHPVGQSIAIFLLTACLGAAYTADHHRRNAPIQPLGDREYEAVVMSEATERRRTVVYDLLVVSVDGTPLDRPFLAKASLWRDTLAPVRPSLLISGGVKAFSSLGPPRVFADPSRRSYARYLQVNGFRAETFIPQGNLVPAAVSTSALGYTGRIRLKALRLRTRLLDVFKRQGLSEDDFAVVAAMTMGSKTALTREVRDRYAITGASHVLAISGLHLGIIYGLLMVLFGRWRRGRWAGHLVVLSAIWAFAFLVGLPTSLIRAATMFTVASLLGLGQRRSTPINTLSLAALLLLIANPNSLWDISFQLSFASVLAILVYFRLLYGLWKPRFRVLRVLWGWAMVSVAAQLGTAPLVAYHFGRFSCYFLLTNMVVVPAAYLLIGLVVVLFVVTPIPWLQHVLASAVSAIVHVMNAAVSTMAAWPGASIEGIHVTMLQVAIIYLLIAALTRPAFILAQKLQKETIPYATDQ